MSTCRTLMAMRIGDHAPQRLKRPYVRPMSDELLGVICGWDRIEANASARKHAAVAELIR